MSGGATIRLGAGATLILLLVGGALGAVGLGMVGTALLGLLGDGEELLPFAVCGVATGVIGVAGVLVSRSGGQPSSVLNPYMGFAAVTLAWVMAAVAGTLPLLWSGAFTSPIDAYFEATSGFTTTGATLLASFEQPDVVFWWRSMMEWLGGIGIVVLVVAVAPVSGIGMQRLFYAETSGVTTDRLTPRIIDTAKILAAVYLALSAAAFGTYLATGMSAFDAANHMMTSVSTGGFSTLPDSIGGFDSTAVEVAVIFFMVVAGVNFAFYWRAIKGKDLMPQLAEVRAYLLILAAITAAVTASVLLAADVEGFGTALRESAFSVTTVMTGTGYVTADFDEWNTFARVTMLTLMFFGACAGSSSGGMKVIRVLLLLKSARQEVERQITPTAVQVLRMGGRPFSEQVRTAVLGFFLLYVAVYAIGSLLMATTGVDPVTAISAAATSLNIVGPGLGEIGATESFAAIPTSGRLVSTILMLIGRLEVFTVVALLAPIFRIRRS